MLASASGFCINVFLSACLFSFLKASQNHCSGNTRAPALLFDYFYLRYYFICVASGPNRIPFTNSLFQMWSVSPRAYLSFVRRKIRHEHLGNCFSQTCVCDTNSFPRSPLQGAKLQISAFKKNVSNSSPEENLI